MKMSHYTFVTRAIKIYYWYFKLTQWYSGFQNLIKKLSNGRINNNKHYFNKENCQCLWAVMVGNKYTWIWHLKNPIIILRYYLLLDLDNLSVFVLNVKIMTFCFVLYKRSSPNFKWFEVYIKRYIAEQL